MATAVEEQDELQELVLEDAWAPGSAVVALGAVGTSGEWLAVWQVTPTGIPIGAWVRPMDEVTGTVAAARQVVALLERRALTAAEDSTVDMVLERVSQAAQLPDKRWWQDQSFRPAEVVQEIARRRQDVEQAVDEAGRRRGKAYTQVEWARDLPAELPVDVEAIRMWAGIAPAEGAGPVSAEALTLSRVLRWLARSWAQTEQPKNRRRYLAEALGPPEALPPSWLAAVTAGANTRLPL